MYACVEGRELERGSWLIKVYSKQESPYKDKNRPPRFGTYSLQGRASVPQGAEAETQALTNSVQLPPCHSVEQLDVDSRVGLTAPLAPPHLSSTKGHVVRAAKKYFQKCLTTNDSSLP